MNTQHRRGLWHSNYLLLGVLTLLIVLPIHAFAATAKPTCELNITTKAGRIITSGKSSVLLNEGGAIFIAWHGDNFTSVMDGNGKSILPSGTVMEKPTGTTEYAYVFSNGSTKVTCSVTIVVASGSIDTASLFTTSTRPTLSGTASGTKSIQLTVRKAGSTAILYKKTAVRVKDGVWSVKSPKTLKYGVYDVVIADSRKLSLNTLATGTLTVSKTAQHDTQAKTTFIVATVPLLSGGIVHGGVTIPVSYLQITNVGKVAATIRGFYITQRGNASVDSIVGLSTIDDAGGSIGSVGGSTGSMLVFTAGTALAPTNAVFAPGQMKLFTIKVQTPQNIASYIGKQLVLDVTGIMTDATAVKGTPIHGTTWTFGM